MQAPVIGISGSHLVDGSGVFASYPRSYVNHDYIRSVHEAGGLPFIVPFLESEEAVRALVGKLDGLVLSGGHDVDPALYGQEPRQGLGDIWPERDRFDTLLFEEARRRGIPILAICRGFQLVNVLCGGTLHQDLRYTNAERLKHAQNQRPDLATHTIHIEENTLLHEALDGATTWRVNSFHHQVVDQPGQNVVPMAYATDGTLEAFTLSDGSYVAAYQFHPEMMTATHPNAAALFRHFIIATQEGNV